MDTVTHTLVGTAISDCYFRRRLGPTATPFALIVSAMPDLDLLAYFISPEYAWLHHRGYTHSFLPMLLISPLLGCAGYFLSRRQGTWGQWTLLAVLCLFCHTVIDLVTSWGTMPWLPFSNARVSWDIAPILDVFVFSLSAASFIANRLLRWEKVEHFLNPLAYPLVHRHPGRQRVADWFGRAAVILMVIYLVFGWHENRQTVRIAREELAAAGINAVEVRALPIMFTWVAWGIAARDAEGTVYNAVYSSYAPKPMRFTKYPMSKDSVVRQAIESPEGKLFAWYAQDMFTATVDESGSEGKKVLLVDRRFFNLTRPDLPRFAMEFGGFPAGRNNGAFLTASNRRGFGGVDLRAEAESLWRLLIDGEVPPSAGK